MYRRKFVASVAATLVFAVSPASWGADVLQNVPPDALGFVVVRNAGATDAKLQRLLATLQVDVVGPLAFLENAIGISAGLDQQGDFMLVVIPGVARADKPDFCVWLPVSNYEALVSSLGSKPAPGVTAVTIAGEDLLIAQHGDWAVVMDPEQRARMEQLLAATPAAPAQVAVWKTWIESNNVTAVALAPGVRAMLHWSSQTETSLNLNSNNEPSSDEDLFGSNDIPEENPFAAAPSRRAPANDISTVVRSEFRKWISASPDLARWASQTTAVGGGLRLDADGNALAGARIAMDDNFFSGADERHANDGALPPALYQGGDFIVNGAARWSRCLAAPLASALVRQMASDLTNEEHLKVDQDIVAELQKAAERAAADTISTHFFSRPGENQEGLYTNNFLVVRATSAAEFIEHAALVMELWNKMNLAADGATRFVFNFEQIKLGERTAGKYSLDLMAADNMPALPDIRQSMEKFFGPGGKMQLWIVPVDDKTALLASATPEQVTVALEVLDRKQPIDWKRPELAGANHLLPDQSAARVFFSPSGYNRWLRRLMDAMVGTTVIGGPLVKDFPASPPIGIAAGANEHELWADVGVPAQTIQAAGPYLKTRKRIQIQR